MQNNRSKPAFRLFPDVTNHVNMRRVLGGMIHHLLRIYLSLFHSINQRLILSFGNIALNIEGRIDSCTTCIVHLAGGAGKYGRIQLVKMFSFKLITVNFAGSAVLITFDLRDPVVDPGRVVYFVLILTGEQNRQEAEGKRGENMFHGL